MAANEISHILIDTPDAVKPSAEYSEIYNNMRRGVNAICDTLIVSTQEYEPNRTANEIRKFTSSEKRVFRILYSEISIRIMNMPNEQRGVFSTNVEKLLFHIIELDERDDDTVKIVFKIYDHTQLVLNQVKNVDEMLSPRIEEAKLLMRDDMKTIEREYITILGIFAAIMLAFVGAFTFSTSVLNNIGQASFFRLAGISTLIGIVFYGILSLLISFLYEINGKSRPERSIWKIYALIFVIGVVAGFVLFCKLEMIESVVSYCISRLNM